jgi:hypothetical protein
MRVKVSSGKRKRLLVSDNGQLDCAREGEREGEREREREVIVSISKGVVAVFIIMQPGLRLIYCYQELLYRLEATKEAETRRKLTLVN